MLGTEKLYYENICAILKDNAEPNEHIQKKLQQPHRHESRQLNQQKRCRWQDRQMQLHFNLIQLMPETFQVILSVGIVERRPHKTRLSYSNQE